MKGDELKDKDIQKAALKGFVVAALVGLAFSGAVVQANDTVQSENRDFWSDDVDKTVVRKAVDNG